MPGMTRQLGRSGIAVGDIGIGTWVMGGPFYLGDQPLGWGAVDDDESVTALHRAFELGATLVDTADTYGAGHAERVVGKAVAGRRDAVVIATKWGNTFDEDTRQKGPADPSPGYVRTALEGSLRRLGTDYVDVFQLHLGDLDPVRVLDLAAECERLLDDGLIRAYGWSTDDPRRMAALAGAGRAAVVQQGLNVFDDAPEMLAACDRYDLGSLNRSPLAMGLLTDKVTADTVIGADDIRGREPEWLRWFSGGRPSAEFLARRDAVRDILTSNGRTLAQGALAWNLARSPRTVPIPGCRTVAQVEQNLGTLTKPGLTADEMSTVDRLLGRAA
jgi:aryl-alcohol dehydrogenase-like predicted oxidoreductase